MKSYAVLFAPEFRLQAALRHEPGESGAPAALLETPGTKPRVGELNAAATARRVERGLSPTQALARCPGLRLLHAHAGRERSAQEAMLQVAEGLSPFLEATERGVVTVELPPERAFTGDDFFARAVAPLRALGLEIGVGVAETPDLARLAARFARPVLVVSEPAAFLEPLPIAALQPDEELGAVLAAWGVRTIGQFTALPRAQMWERLGPAAIRLAGQAAGGQARPLRLVKPREFFAERADLEHPVELLEPLLFLLRRFLEQIAARLAHAYRAAGRLRLVLRFEQGEAYRRTFTLPQPTRDVNLLFRLLHTHLENFTSPSPIVGLELAARPARPGAEQAGLLERGLRDPYQFAETLARLEALLGAGRVGAPALEPSHHPEAFGVRAYDPAPKPTRAEEEVFAGVPWLRFRPPLPARVVLEETRPAFLQSSRGSGPIRDARGPWLADGRWWEARRWAREEWDIATGEGIYRLARLEDGWFLAGIYG
jgi:protein ImuB